MVGHVAPSRISDYTLIAQIGRGSFGTVYLAESLLGKRCAVKVLIKPRVGELHVARGASQYDPQKELTGIRNYQKIATGHPNLVQVLHVGETEDCFYYVMELADDENELRAADQPRALPPSEMAQTDPRSAAERQALVTGSHAYAPATLKSLIERSAPLLPQRALDISAAILRGLAHLHEHGLIHRDVKPANVLFVNGVPKLADLGLVSTTDRDLTLVGTPGYMPLDGRMDQSADLYAAGIVLYEMITGFDRARFPE